VRDRLQDYWQERFALSATQCVGENAVNVYTAHGWNVRRRVFAGILDRLRRAGRIRPGMRALDVGCGSGAYARDMATAGLRVVAVDLCRNMLIYARRHASSVHPGTIAFARANGLALPLRQAAFDLVVSIGVLQHVADPDRFIAGCCRAVAPTGTVVIMTLNRKTIPETLRTVCPWPRPAPEGDPAIQLRRYSSEDIRRIVHKHLPDARIRVRPVCVFSPSRRAAESWANACPGTPAMTMPLAVSFTVVAERQA
jgi:SAM-dependent methyltransferase